MPKSHTGFSLLEMLLVLVILGVLYGIASVSLNGIKANPIEQASSQLGGLIRLTQNEAVIRSQVLGILIDQKGYQVLEQAAPKEWLPIKLSKAERYDFEPKLEVQLYLDQIPVILPEYREPTELEQFLGTDQETPQQPQIVMLPTGEMTPFGFEWSEGASTLKQHWDGVGRVSDASDSTS
jgi:type II secretion system protein H